MQNSSLPHFGTTVIRGILSKVSLRHTRERFPMELQTPLIGIDLPIDFARQFALDQIGAKASSDPDLVNAFWDEVSGAALASQRNALRRRIAAKPDQCNPIALSKGVDVGSSGDKRRPIWTVGKVQTLRRKRNIYQVSTRILPLGRNKEACISKVLTASEGGVPGRWTRICAL